MNFQLEKCDCSRPGTISASYQAELTRKTITVSPSCCGVQGTSLHAPPPPSEIQVPCPGLPISSHGVVDGYFLPGLILASSLVSNSLIAALPEFSVDDVFDNMLLMLFHVAQVIKPGFVLSISFCN